MVDAHVHLNDPGRADWEGFATGTAALAAGGTTTCIDMPLNAIPPTLDGAAFDAKVAAATGVARVDVALWGGLVPGDLDRLDELAARGVVGFKAFMSASGVAEFAAADDLTLLEGMARAAALGLPVAVHAESDALTSALAARAVAEGRVTMRDYLGSRPVVAELEAIGRAILLAEETGCALHVVHVSTGRGVALVARGARPRGRRDVRDLPALPRARRGRRRAARRGREVRAAAALRGRARRRCGRGSATSRWSPATTRRRPPRSRTGDDHFAIWGGISGAQTLLAVLWDAGVAAGAARRAARVRAGASGFGLAEGRARGGRGRRRRARRPRRARGPSSADTLLDRHKLSPFAGRTFRGRVVRTMLRGRTIALDGRVVGEPSGRVQTATRPARRASSSADAPTA